MGWWSAWTTFASFTGRIMAAGIFFALGAKKARAAEGLNFEQIYQAFIDADPRLVYLKDENLKLIMANAALQSFLGKETRELEGFTLHRFVSPEIAALSEKTDRLVLKTGDSITQKHFWGNRLWEITKFPVTLARGRRGIGARIEDKSRAYCNQLSLADAERELNRVNGMLTSILSSSPEIIAFSLDSHYRYLSFNLQHQKLAKQIWDAEITAGLNMLEIFKDERMRRGAKERFDRALAGHSFSQIEKYDYGVRPVLSWHAHYAPLRCAQGKVFGLTCFVLNITKRVETEEKLKERERLLREAQRAAHIGSFLFHIPSRTWKISEELYEILGIDPHYFQDEKGVAGLIPTQSRFKLFRYFAEARDKREPFDHVFQVIGSDGRKRWLHGLGKFEYNAQGEAVRLMGTIQDITERKRAEEEIDYLTYHDCLTELYNRRFFKEELARIDSKENLPLSIIMADLDGLKLTNDVFGHEAGDLLLRTTANVFKQICRPTDIITRVGGDEFIILLPKTGEEQARQILKRIEQECSQTTIKSFKISLSLGLAIKTERDQDIEEIVEAAEEQMYDQKTVMYEELSSRALGAIIAYLHRDRWQKQHSRNVSVLAWKLGAALNLSKLELQRLKKAGFLHDIGKVSPAVDEGKSQQHSLVGYRILQNFPRTADIAGIVLAHHERWDGEGKPRGLHHRKIPRLARVLAVADSYDHLINPSQGKGRSPREALERIRNQGGTKFDPKIVTAFVSLMEATVSLPVENHP
ncbi:MAG: diguanylate cyclase [Firmicutes bacterium]|nr:diguanylate cyclase [Bacillota bacterium]